MLRLKLELVPFGDEDHAREIGRMVIANDGKSDHPAFGMYEAWLGPDNYTGKGPRYLRLDGHLRSQGAWVLVRDLLNRILTHPDEPSKDKDSLAQRLKSRL